MMIRNYKQPFCKTICILGNQAYLHLQTDRMKRESNIKKGRQKEQHNFRRTFPSRASLLSQTFQSFDNIYSATITKSTKRPKALSFDTDSFELLVDNGASRSITNNKSDFIDIP